jgi:multidrug resistance efflux pump
VISLGRQHLFSRWDIKMIRFQKKYLLWLILLVPVSLFLVWPAVERMLSPRIDVITSAGTVEGNEVNINSKIQGRIAAIYFDEGDTVSKGDVLLQLADEDLLAKVNLGKATLEKARAEVLVASARVQNMQAAIDNTLADIQAAEADVSNYAAKTKDAERHRQQMRTLYEKNAVSQESFDAAITAYDAAVAAEKAAQAKVESVKAQHKEAVAQKNMAENQLLSTKAGVQEAESELEYQDVIYAETLIRSPISGVVVYKALREGETVNPSMTIMTIVDLDRLTVRVDLDESHIGSIQIGSRTIIKASANQEHAAEGVVSAINPYADFATQKDVTGGRQDIKTFRVTIDLKDASKTFHPGMTVSVQISKK